jgi:hypothetical protein
VSLKAAPPLCWYAVVAPQAGHVHPCWRYRAHKADHSFDWAQPRPTQSGDIVITLHPRTPEDRGASTHPALPYASPSVLRLEQPGLSLTAPAGNANSGQARVVAPHRLIPAADRPGPLLLLVTPQPRERDLAAPKHGNRYAHDSEVRRVS